jgi:hypothetical protein
MYQKELVCANLICFDLVASKSEEYVPIIKGMVEEWRKGKERFMQQVTEGAIPMQPLDDDR